MSEYSDVELTPCLNTANVQRDILVMTVPLYSYYSTVLHSVEMFIYIYSLFSLSLH